MHATNKITRRSLTRTNKDLQNRHPKKTFPRARSKDPDNLNIPIAALQGV
jgi:hypothetical protein